MTVNRHADGGIRQCRRDASMSHADAVGQIMTQRAFDGDAIAMDASKFDSQQRGKRNLGKEACEAVAR